MHTCGSDFVFNNLIPRQMISIGYVKVALWMIFSLVTHGNCIVNSNRNKIKKIVKYSDNCVIINYLFCIIY